MPKYPPVDVVILTVLPEEYAAVCSILPDLRPFPGIDSSTDLYACKLGDVHCPSYGDTCVYTVAVGMVGRAGTNHSTSATLQLILEFKPKYVFLTGIAGGFSEVNKGDVVIADIIRGYEYGKIDENFEPRGRTYETDQGLLNHATACEFEANWRELIQEIPLIEMRPKFIIGEIASGDKVVDDPENEFFEQVRKTWPKVRAVEMEAAGVGNAINQARDRRKQVGFMVIRGISDLPRSNTSEDERGTKERDKWKLYAANVAAAFTVGMIANRLPVKPHHNNKVIQVIDVDEFSPEISVKFELVDEDEWQEIKERLMNPGYHHQAVEDIRDLPKNHCPSDGIINDMLRWIKTPMSDFGDPEFSRPELEEILIAMKVFCKKAIEQGQLMKSTWLDINSTSQDIAFDIMLPDDTNYNSSSRAWSFEIIKLLNGANLLDDEDITIDKAEEFICSAHKNGYATSEYGENYIRNVVDWLRIRGRKTQLCNKLKTLERTTIDENIRRACGTTRTYLNCFL